MFHDKIQLQGELAIDDDDTLNYVDLVTDLGVRTAASCLGSPYNTQEWMPYVSIGSGETAPSTSDITLEDEKHRKKGTVWVASNTYFVEATFGADEPIGDIVVTEVGIHDAYSGGNLGARFVLDDDSYIQKEDTDVIVVKVAISVL